MPKAALFIIREANAADIPALAQLHVTTWNATYAPMLMNGPAVGVREKQWREAFAKQDGSWFCFVVENASGELVGFAKGTKSDHPEYEGELNKIYLLREYQGRGLGRRLVGHVCAGFSVKPFRRCGYSAMRAIHRPRYGWLWELSRPMTIPQMATTAGAICTPWPSGVPSIDQMRQNPPRKDRQMSTQSADGWSRWIVAPLIVVTVILAAASAPAADPPADRSRVFVLTDISNEPDDEESLVRFLVYANEYDIEGLVATTSTWLRNRTREDLLRRQIDAYGKVRENLAKHAEHFPTKEQLLAVTATGQTTYGMAAVGDDKTTAGSKLLLAAADKPDDRPLWVSIWGGANTLAQALHDARRERSADDLKKLVAKLRVYTISDQDDAGVWLRREFPELFYIVSPSNTDSKEYWRSHVDGDQRRSALQERAISQVRDGGQPVAGRKRDQESRPARRCIRSWPSSWKATRRRSWASSTTVSVGTQALLTAAGADGTCFTKRLERRDPSGPTTWIAATR